MLTDSKNHFDFLVSLFKAFMKNFLCFCWKAPGERERLAHYLFTSLMVQNAAEGKEDVSVNVEQGCSHAELSIVGNGNSLGLVNFSDYSTRQH